MQPTTAPICGRSESGVVRAGGVTLGGMDWYWIVAAVLGVGLVGFAADQLALWMERRGWLYWRRSGRPRGGSLGILETIYQPSMSHVFEQETRQRTEADQDDSGEA